MTDKTTSPQPSASKRIRGDARKRLAKSAARVVLAQSDEIADTLLKHALNGDVRSVRLLTALIEKKKKQARQVKPRNASKPEPPKPQKPKRSLACAWASEPEWTEEDEALAAAEPARSSTDAWGFTHSPTQIRPESRPRLGPAGHSVHPRRRPIH